MSITRQKYNSGKISLLRQLLFNNKQSGKPTDYEIRVDDMKVVPRTNDPEQFDNHEEFVNEETHSVIIILYDGQSRKNTRHIFEMKEEPKPEQNPMSGVDIDKMVDEKVTQVRKQWEYEQLEKENTALKEKKEEAEEYISKLQGIIEDMKTQRAKGDLQWGEIAGIAAEGILRRNTHLIAKVPGMAGLAGVIEQDNKAQPQQVPSPQPEVEATFQKKSDEELSGEDKEWLNFLRQLQSRFSEEEMKQLLTLLNQLAQKTKAIEPAITFINQWSKPATESPKEKKPALNGGK